MCFGTAPGAAPGHQCESHCAPASCGCQHSVLSCFRARFCGTHFLHLCRNSSCVTALSISLTLDVPPPQSFSCSSVHTFVLLSSWCSGNPTLCSTAAAAVCAGSDQTWLRGGQGHPWCPLGVRALCWELQLWLGSTRGVFCAP